MAVSRGGSVFEGCILMNEYEPGELRIAREDGYCVFPVGGDTYRGCSHGCLYCYERQADNQHLRKAQAPTPRDYRQLVNSIYTDPEVRRFVVDFKIPVRLGICSEPLPPIEASERNTLKTLKLLSDLGIPVILSTKAPQRLSAEHLEYLQQPLGVVKVSFSTLDDERARLLEPYAPLPSQRLEAMRAIRAAGIPVVARLNPWLRTEDYDYGLLAGAANGVTVELFRFSVTWRHSFPVQFWEILGEPAPGGARGEFKRGTPEYKWAYQQEHKYFAPFQSEGIPYHSEGIHWVQSDPFILREIFERERDKAHAVGLTWGICSFGNGIHNIDLNEAPYCCCVNQALNYDRLALVPQWHKDRWAGYRCDLTEQLDLNLGVLRLIYANAPSYRPIALDGGHNGESYYVEQDAPERG